MGDIRFSTPIFPATQAPKKSSEKALTSAQMPLPDPAAKCLLTFLCYCSGNTTHGLLMHSRHISLGCLQQIGADWSSGRSVASAVDKTKDGLGGSFCARGSMRPHLHTSCWGALLVRGSSPTKPGADVV